MKNSETPQGYLFSKRYSYYVFVLLFLLYMFDYIDRMVITSMWPSIGAALKITHMQEGMLVSAVYWAIVLLTFPISLLVDRWSRTKTIGIMAIMWSIATALCALTGNYIQLFLARALIGIGEAGYAPGGSAMISALFPMEKRSRMMGLWNAAIPLGTAIGHLLGGVIAVHLGWKHAFGIVAAPGLVIALLFLFLKDYKTVDLAFLDKKKQQKVKMNKKDMVREFITRPSVIYTYFGMACVVFVTTALITWLSTLFQNVQGMPMDKAGGKASVVMVLALVGAPLGGYLTSAWEKHRPEARLLFPALSTLCTAIVLFIALKMQPGTFQYILLLCMGVLIMCFIAGAASVTQDVIHPGLRAISYSIAVIVQNLLGSAMAPMLIGLIYDKTNIETALSILPFILITGSVLFFIGSRYYLKDLEKVAKIKLEAAG
ncbi:MAG: MFS transporter [Bacteroidales bacterium]|jgi:MFS family permease|nr:MFS transporter [Bacteroidales bacterium]